MNADEQAQADLARGLEDALGDEQVVATPAVPVPARPQPTTQASSASPSLPATGAPQEAADPPLWQQLGYADSDTAVESVGKLRHYAAQNKDDASRLAQENATLRQQLEAASGFGRVNPAGYPQQPQPQIDPLDTLDRDFHVPRNLLEPSVDKMVETRVNSLMAPLFEAAKAEQWAQETYGPNYATLKPQIDSFVVGHPDVAQFVNAARAGGQPRLATEYAITRFREAVMNSTHGDITAAAGATNAATQGKRTHAGVFSGRGEETRSRLAEQQAGVSGIDRNEAIARSNAGDDSLMERKAAEMLPWSEEELQAVWRGNKII